MLFLRISIGSLLGFCKERDYMSALEISWTLCHIRVLLQLIWHGASSIRGSHHPQAKATKTKGMEPHTPCVHVLLRLTRHWTQHAHH